jgi:hypothetical protein
MDLDRRLGCAELRSNLFVEHAGNYAFEHVKLAWCERSSVALVLILLAYWLRLHFDRNADG